MSIVYQLLYAGLNNHRFMKKVVDIKIQTLLIMSVVVNLLRGIILIIFAIHTFKKYYFREKR